MYTPHSAASAYAKVGLETGVIAASPHKLILMLFEGAQLSLRMAGMHMRAGNISAKSDAIAKAVSIISSGLKASLDLNRGGDIAVRLDALYAYMCQRLLAANVNNQPELLEEVNALLDELHAAWKQIGAPSSAGSYPAAMPDAARSPIAA